jgi:hypothetical protein
MNETCNESKFGSTVWYFVCMGVLWIVCYSLYLVKYRLALCVCMDVLWIMCHNRYLVKYRLELCVCVCVWTYCG